MTTIQSSTTAQAMPDDTRAQPTLGRSDGQISFNETILIDVMIGNATRKYAVDADNLDADLKLIKQQILAKLKENRERDHNWTSTPESGLSSEEHEENMSAWMPGTRRRTSVSLSDSEPSYDSPLPDSPSSIRSNSERPNHDSSTASEDRSGSRPQSPQQDTSVHTPSDRTKAIYEKSLVRPAFVNKPFPEDAGLPRRNESCLEDGNDSKTDDYYEDLLDLYKLAYHLGNDQLMLQILLAWQAATLDRKSELPDLRLIVWAFDNLPHTVPLLKYLVDVYAIEWEMYKHSSYEGYVPSGQGFERFLFGIASIRAGKMVQMHHMDLIKDWCKYHEHGDDRAAERKCQRWRDRRKGCKDLRDWCEDTNNRIDGTE